MSVFQHILAFFIFLIIRENYKAYYENIINERWNDQDEGWLSKVKDGIEKAGEGASNLIEKGKQALSNLIDGIAILLITSCIIPIAVLIFLLWIVKMIFNVNITIQNSKKFFKEKKEKVDIEENE